MKDHQPDCPRIDCKCPQKEGSSIISIQNRFIPEGSELVEAYETEKEIIVCGNPEDEPDATALTNEEMEAWYETAHNCDAMGCGSLSHVLYRFNKELPSVSNALPDERKAGEEVQVITFSIGSNGYYVCDTPNKQEGQYVRLADYLEQKRLLEGLHESHKRRFNDGLEVAADECERLSEDEFDRLTEAAGKIRQLKKETTRQDPEISIPARKLLTACKFAVVCIGAGYSDNEALYNNLLEALSAFTPAQPDAQIEGLVGAATKALEYFGECACGLESCSNCGSKSVPAGLRKALAPFISHPHFCQKCGEYYQCNSGVCQKGSTMLCIPCFDGTKGVSA